MVALVVCGSYCAGGVRFMAVYLPTLKPWPPIFARGPPMFPAVGHGLRKLHWTLPRILTLRGFPKATPLKASFFVIWASFHPAPNLYRDLGVNLTKAEVQISGSHIDIPENDADRMLMGARDLLLTMLVDMESREQS